MSTDRPARTPFAGLGTSAATGTHRPRWHVRLAVALATTLGLSAAVAAAGHPAMAAGIITGGVFSIVFAVAARTRAVRRADRAGSVSRVAGGVADERDLRIVTVSQSWVGVLAVLLASLASAATYLGASGDVLVRTMPFTLLVVAAVSYVVVSRRS